MTTNVAVVVVVVAVSVCCVAWLSYCWLCGCVFVSHFESM